jgi:hypothetical protein
MGRVRKRAAQVAGTREPGVDPRQIDLWGNELAHPRNALYPF